MPKTKFEAMWPLPIPGLVVVTGEYGSGKSTFGLSTGAEPERIVTVDYEKGQSSFAEQLGTKNHDMQAIMAEEFPKGYKPIELYKKTLDIVDAIPAGSADVLVIDNGTPLEEAIVAYVQAFPTKYGHSAQQYTMMSGLMWGDVKTEYGQFITRAQSKVKMVVIIVHLRDKWAGKSVVKNAFNEVVREPKGKDTLDQLSSLSLWLEPGPGGVPSATVRKCRIDRKVYVADPKNPPADIPAKYLEGLKGEAGIVSIPVLPLRLPKCTWAEIREYERNPADLVNPKPGETPSKQQLTDDDRLKLRAMTAQAELETLQIKTSGNETYAGTPTRPAAPAPAKPAQKAVPQAEKPA